MNFTTRITRTTEITSDRSTSRTEARIVPVWSMIVVNLIDCGMDAWSWGRTSRILSTVSMILAPGWRQIATCTAGPPL